MQIIIEEENLKKRGGNMIKEVLSVSVLFLLMPVFAESTHGRDGEISGRSVGTAACSLIIWPGIGQAINKQSAEKNITHAVLGLTGIFRIWYSIMV